MWMGGPTRGAETGDLAYNDERRAPDRWDALLRPRQFAASAIRSAVMFRGRLYVALIETSVGFRRSDDRHDAVASIAPGDAFLRFELLSWNEREPVGQEIFSLSTDGGSRLVVMSKSGSRGGRAYQFDGRTWALICRARVHYWFISSDQ